MDIVVIVKCVPDTADAEITIDRTGKDIDKEGLAFDINEWDNYAMEEAVQLKERLGGSVTAVGVGSEEVEEVLRRCIALGADEAIRLDDPAFAGGDNYATAVLLAAAIRNLPHDLILTGMMASDDGDGQVGGAVAQLLGLPCTTMVTRIEVESGKVRVRRELEGGLEEQLEIAIPALVTVQTGINEPRYVPIAGIRRAARREIASLGLAQLGLRPEQVGAAAARVEVEELLLPRADKVGETLQGSPDAVAEQLVAIFGRKGWVG
ncbi:MAG: electron transfer flavoprotein subunit beta/FixA family protein [Sphingomonadaceae bacterium]